MIDSASNVEELAQAVLHALPRLDRGGVRLALAVFRELAKGAPVSEAALVREIGLQNDQVKDLLQSWPGVYRDGADNIVGFWGLAVVDLPPHRYRIGATQLSTWCAYDTLYITHILGAEAHVESVDALSGEPIRLTVTPSGVTEQSHSGLVMSFLNPDTKFDADVLANFCHFVHFFATRENGERWAADCQGIFLLELGDAFTLAQRHVEGFLS